jgi:hypothetical protein
MANKNSSAPEEPPLVSGPVAPPSEEPAKAGENLVEPFARRQGASGPD